MSSGSWAGRLAAASLAFVLGAAAAAPASRAAEPSDAGRPATMFPKGTWDLEFYGAYHETTREGDETVAIAVASAGYYFGDRHSIRVELAGYDLDNKAGPSTADPDDARAFGGNAGLRYQFIEYRRLTLFVEGYTGFVYSDRDFPEDGTHLNFNLQAGLGTTFRLRENLHLVGGARYLHMSNARLRGEDENPSFDGVGGYLGVLFTF